MQCRIIICTSTIMIYCTFVPIHIISYPAVVIDSVVDLMGQPIETFYPSMPTSEAYNTIPLCAGNLGRWIGCPRLHQLLYNEVVEIVKTRKREVKIRIPNLFFITMHNKKKQTEYWAPKHSFVPIETLQSRNINLDIIPKSINFRKNNALSPHIVTLTLPHHDKETGIFFSAGTRFVRTDNTKSCKEGHIPIIFYNPQTKKPAITIIPQACCFIPMQKSNPDTQRIAFVDIIKQWAHMPSGFIPYVWGGCSITHTQTGNFKEKTKKQNNTMISYFSYGKSFYKKPYTGLDCSGLISRAAQIVGIPYFFKNSYTVSEYLTPLVQGNHLRIGDIIWVPGHVMVISDVKHNLLIEARSYFSGYGKVHEIDLCKVFNGINTYHELENAFFSKRPIERIDSKGSVQKSAIQEYKLLPIDGLWSSCVIDPFL